MAYVLTVTLHLVTMVAWIGAMIAAPFALSRGGSVAGARALLRGVATPALVLTWILGIANAVQGGWFDDGWLHVKLVFVLALSALHGIALGRLRRFEAAGAAAEVPAFLRTLPWITLALLAGAVLMAVWKPF